MILKYQGLPASPGAAIGPIWVYQPHKLVVETSRVENAEEELDRLEKALQVSSEQLKVLIEKTRVEMGDAEAEIFEAHRMILEDPELKGMIQSRVRSEKLNLEQAVNQSVEQFASTLEKMDSAYFRERAQDVRDVGRRLILNLQGIDPTRVELPREPVIILAEELTPSDTVQFERESILGFCTRKGGPTSHAAILAQSLNIPAVVSAPFDFNPGWNGKQAILDGSEGIFYPDPDPELLKEYRQKISSREKEWNKLLAVSGEKAVTLDGIAVEVVANIGSTDDARQALELGAEGVGLLRTEFLYIERDSFPELEEQIEVYRQIGEIMGDRPIVVRTLDIGGDKPLPYLDLAEEPNPFLGWRAIRMIRENPQILAQQLKALLLGFAGRDLRIMLPLVSRVEEVKHARRILDQVMVELREEEDYVPGKLQFGMMVEVPSAALQAGDFTKYVDFFSIGTNDLAQYTLAVDRTNERVADLASPFHPAVIRLIAATIEQAHAGGKWVGLCGEMAGNELAAPLLLGLGLDEFSMAPAAIPRVKAVLRKLDSQQSRKDAARILTHAATDEVLKDLKGIVDRL